MPDRLLRAIGLIEAKVREAGERGETVYTLEVVRAVREEIPDLPISSDALTQLVADMAVKHGAAVKIEVPLEVVGDAPAPDSGDQTGD